MDTLNALLDDPHKIIEEISLDLPKRCQICNIIVKNEDIKYVYNHVVCHKKSCAKLALKKFLKRMKNR